MTKAAMIALAREVADATGSGRWDNTLLLGPLLGTLHWQEWGHLLNKNKSLRMTSQSVTPVAGLFAKSALTATDQNFYRIISINNGISFYTPGDYLDYPNLANTGEQRYIWYESGDNIQLVDTTSSPVTVTFNHRPTKADLLADTDTVVWPLGHEAVLYTGLASLMLMKGGTETEASRELKQLVDNQFRKNMLDDIGRISTSPIRMRAPDDAEDWGSV